MGLRHLLFSLRPAELDRLGLAGALEMQFEQMRDQTGISFEVRSNLTREPTSR